MRGRWVGLAISFTLLFNDGAAFHFSSPAKSRTHREFSRVPRFSSFPRFISPVPTKQPKNRRRWIRHGSACLVILSSLTRIAAATVSQPPVLEWRNGIAAASLVLLALSGLMLSIPDIAKAILQACVRSTIQLYLIGGFLLTRFLVSSNTKPWMVGIWILFTGIMAGREASNRVEYIYDGMKTHLVWAVLTGGISIMGLSLLLGVLGSINPWYDPRTWIPVAGMIFGNSLTAISLAMASVTKELAVNRHLVEVRLCHGATIQEAMRPVRRTVLTTAFNPVINFLTAAGIVHIPGVYTEYGFSASTGYSMIFLTGMMTGQLLAGQAPFQAAGYQLIIFFMIASTAIVSVQILLKLAEASLSDRAADRLRLEKLRRKRVAVSSTWSTKLGTHSSLSLLWRLARGMHSCTNGAAVEIDAAANERPPAQVLTTTRAEDCSAKSDSVLCVERLYSLRANAFLSLNLKKGDRLAIVGPSGVGKSHILRTLAGLESVDRSAIRLSKGRRASQMSMSEWRSQIMLIPQEDRPVEGTPNEFYEELTFFSSQKIKRKGRSLTHVEYCQEWGMKADLLDQPWTTLSGGESQRIRLAIALSLHPSVLLLDESTSAIDKATTLKVEATLIAMGIAVIMISHSQSQVERFCSQCLDVR